MYMTDAERKEPLEFHAIGPCYTTVFKCARRDLVGRPLIVTARGRTDRELCAAVLEFTMWWADDVYSRLNGFQGWSVIEWEIRR